MQLTFTLDLEDHRGTGEKRYRENASRILDFLESLNIRATIFIVGTLIKDERDLIKRASRSGHELALHSFRHTPLAQENRHSYGRHLLAAKQALEDASGQAIHGYRAPVFSLTPTTCWVLPILRESGIKYSSSVLPGRHSIYNFPGTPRRSFLWPQGLVEIPVPLASVLGIKLPFLGGVYLRYLPQVISNTFLNRQPTEQPLWTYLHPYDIDVDEPYYRFPDRTAFSSWLLWRNRKNTLDKLRLLSEMAPVGPPFSERLAAGEFENAPLFEPSRTDD